MREYQREHAVLRHFPQNIAAQLAKMVEGGLHGTGTCANANCHNGKNTNSVANFTWHGTGTQNCLLCHNDITVTTASTTGATHQRIAARAAIAKAEGRS